MPAYRCPKHDSIFESVMDHRPPGSAASATLPAHPYNGHPDCPKCQQDPSSQLSLADKAKLAAARAAELKAASDKASKEAADALAAVPAEGAPA